MPKRLTLTIPHHLGAAEARRRLDLHTEWALRQLAREKIAIEADEWFGMRRSFTAIGHGLRGGAAIHVADDALHIEALVPKAVGAFGPTIEAFGRQYVGRLLSDEEAG